MAESTAKVVYHDWLNLSQLSQITADMGTIIAGLIRDRESKIQFNLAERYIIVKDEYGTIRIKIGKIQRGESITWSDDIEWEEGIRWAPALNDYGIQIYDSDGTLLYMVGFGIFPEITWWTES